jgi:hypothetical protein
VFNTPDYIHEPLYVVTTVFNAVRYKSRWKHFERFARHIESIGGVLVTVEAAFGDRHHALDAGVTHHGVSLLQRAPDHPTEFSHTRTSHPHLYVKVRTTSEVWIKENLINIGVQHLPEDWKYMAWVDADVMFARPNIVGETIHQLQHYKVLQMFSESQDVGPRYASLGKSIGFGHNWVKGIPMPTLRAGDAGAYYPYAARMPGGQHGWHTGYAWAMRRDAWDELGGLIDFAMLGSADNHMAHALVGELERTINGNLSPAYKTQLREWEFRAERHIRRNVGYVSGLLVHYWHGRKVDRRYRHRWRILTENQFDPTLDLKKDWQGLLQLVDRGDARSIKLRDEVRRYFRARNEDSIELDGVPDET